MVGHDVTGDYDEYDDHDVGHDVSGEDEMSPNRHRWGGGDDDDGGGASRVVVVGVRKKLSRLDFWWWTSTPTGQGHVWQLGCHHIFSILMTLDI